MRRLVVAGLVAGSCGAAVPRVEAQISPGALSSSHAALEGSRHCLECHDPREGVSSGKCLACHRLLRERVAAGKGAHAQADYRDCRLCHVEHQGTNVDLVWWGKAGLAGFNHRLTGYELAGAHARLECEACHRRKLRVAPAALAAGGANSSRTYLGLDTACVSCHEDVHRGQLAGRGCASCHGVESWRPVTGFDHTQSSYPLTGRHATVACGRCHPHEPRDPRRLRYRGIAFHTCAACHRDPHGGRLGTKCETCHTTAGFDRVDRTRFDHSKTAYPLTGRHVGVACVKCHRDGGRGARVAHTKCTDCHADAHLGQLISRADHGRCEACHTVEGFEAPRFSLEDHAATRYPLEGAHRAVPCNACHTALPKARLRRAAQSGVAAGRLSPTRLRLDATGCADCHRGAHTGETSRIVRAGECTACHDVSSWRAVSFDHATARLPLTGRHASVPCDACHRASGKARSAGALRLAGIGQACQDCHRDPHDGDLARPGLASPCERCHDAFGWRVRRFDHAREALFALGGAHSRLECRACHKPEIPGSTQLRYKPLPTTCKGCHRKAGASAEVPS